MSIFDMPPGGWKKPDKVSKRNRESVASDLFEEKIARIVKSGLMVLPASEATSALAFFKMSWMSIYLTAQDLRDPDLLSFAAKAPAMFLPADINTPEVFAVQESGFIRAVARLRFIYKHAGLHDVERALAYIGALQLELLLTRPNHERVLASLSPEALALLPLER
jgi:hypothetical protein